MMKRQLMHSAAVFLLCVCCVAETHIQPADSWEDSLHRVRRLFLLLWRILASPIGEVIRMYVLCASVLAAVANWLLLTASSQFLNAAAVRWRILLGAAAGAALTAVAMSPLYPISHTLWWRLMTLLVAGLCAFGSSKAAVRSLLLFSALHLSLGGLSAGDRNLFSMVLGALGIFLACVTVGIRGQLVQVRIPCRDQILKLTALRDTGNTLTDPVTGKSVLVVDAQTAHTLLDLNPQQLRDPVKTMQHIPGFRLVPYRTIDSSGFLLAKQIDGVCVGSKQGSTLVAFSPQELGSNYQALTGGTLW